MKKKMNLKLYILLFCAAIFVMTAVGLVVFYVGEQFLIFWLIVAYLIAYPSIYIIFVPLLAGDGKLSRKKILLLASSITILTIAVTNSVWTITTPKWSFSIATDKSSYRLGEDVRITAVLKNNGYITHSFKSYWRDPIEITIGKAPIPGGTWYSPNEEYVHTVSVPPRQSIERTVVWNQTTLKGELAEPGVYAIAAAILDGDRWWKSIFEAQIQITITE